MPSDRAAIRSLALWLGLFGASIAVATAVVLPVRAAQVGFDAAASVLYFDRIVSGRPLEAFITATPKPFLTVLYGATHAIVADWRAISWLAIAAFGLAVVLAARLALRLAGPMAAAFAAACVMGSSALVADVGLAYGLVWAMIGWLVAGLALALPTPRYLVAGLGLLLAGTVRFESNLLSGVAVLTVVGWALVARSGHVAGPPRRAWLIALALLALPIQAVHDVLLIGDPGYSLSVPIRGTPSDALLGPLGRVVWLGQRYIELGGLVVLGAVGVVSLAIARHWPIVIGLTLLGPGIGAFLVGLEVRHIYVSSRYAAPIDLALAFSAAIGFGVVAGPRLADVAVRLGNGHRATARAIPVGLALLAGVLFASPFAAASASVVGTARGNLALHRGIDAAEQVLARTPAWLDLAAARMAASPPTSEARSPILLVPVLLRPQVAVDLHLPVTAIGRLTNASVDPTGSGLVVGQFVFHSRHGDPDDPAFDSLETEAATSLGPIRIVPIASDGRLGWWLVHVESRPG